MKVRDLFFLYAVHYSYEIYFYFFVSEDCTNPNIDENSGSDQKQSSLRVVYLGLATRTTFVSPPTKSNMVYY